MKTKENSIKKLNAKLIAIIVLVLVAIGSIFAFFKSSDVVANLFKVKPQQTITYEYYTVNTLDGTITHLDKQELNKEGVQKVFPTKTVTLGADESLLLTAADLPQDMEYIRMDFQIEGEEVKRETGYEFIMPENDLTINQYYYLTPLNGNIIIHHYRAGVAQGQDPVKVAEDEEITGLIGKEFSVTNLIDTKDDQTDEYINKLIIDGTEVGTPRNYLSSTIFSYQSAETEVEGLTPDTEGKFEGTIAAGDIEINYYYNALAYNISGEVVGGNGTISEITEEVLLGNDSTKDIIFTPNVGYRVEKIMVYSGDEIAEYRQDPTAEIGTEIEEFDEEMDLDTGKLVATMDKFTDVRADKLVVVSFEPRPYVAQIIAVPSDKEDLTSTIFPGELIINHKYYSLQDALDDAYYANQESTETAKMVEILIIDNIRNESVSVIRQKSEEPGSDESNVSIDLNGFTINSNKRTKPTINVNDKSTLIVKDSSVLETGKIISKHGVGIFVESDAELTLGVDKKPISIKSPYIEGTEYGIFKEQTQTGETDPTTGQEIMKEGTLNFYDGKVVGETAIYGTVNDTPVAKEVYVEYDDVKEKHVAYLTNTENIEAVIGKVEYTTVEQAIQEANDIYGENGEPVTVQMVSGAQVESTMQIKEGRNITLDLNGMTITSQESAEIFKNSGGFTIIDSTDEEFDNVLVRTNTTPFTVTEEGKLTIQDVEYKTVSAYIVLDLTEYSSEEDVTVAINAEQTVQYSDVMQGFAKLRTTRLAGTAAGETDRILYLTGNTEGTGTATVKGGKKYYLHFGLTNTNPSGANSFTVNSIKVNGEEIKVGSVNGAITKTTGRAIVNDEGATLVINNGKISSNSIEDKGTVLNNGDLTINGGYITGVARSSPYGHTSAAVENTATGTFTLNGGTLNNTDSYGYSFYNKGAVTVNDGVCMRTIDNNGTGTMEYNNGLFLQTTNNSGTGSIAETGASLIVNNGDISEINSSGSAKTIIKNTNTAKYTKVNNSTSNTIIEGGSVSQITNSSSGNIEMTGGKIEYTGNKNSGAVNNTGSGSITIKGTKSEIIITDTNTEDSYGTIYSYNASGTITLGGKVKVTSSRNIVDNFYGTINLQSGTYIENGESMYMIDIADYGTAIVNIGVKNSTVQNPEFSQTSPSLRSKNLGINNEGIVNFYDGEIIATEGKEIIGTIAEIEKEDTEGNKLAINVSTINNMEGYGEYEGKSRMILKPITSGVARILKSSISQADIETLTNDDYYEETDSDNGNEYYYFYTINNAVSVCSTSAGSTKTTIELVDEVSQFDGIDVLEGQNIILNINGNTITHYGNNKLFNNSGTLEIKDTATTGIINSKGEAVINNANSTLVLSVNITTVKEDSTAISNNGNLTINGGTITGYKSTMINNTGTLEINNGTINAMRGVVSAGNYLDGTNIINSGTGKCTINGGTLYNNATGYFSSGYGIKNRDTATLKVNGGTINIPNINTIENTSVSKYIEGTSDPAVYITAGTIKGGTIKDDSSRESDFWIKKDANKELTINSVIEIKSASLTMKDVTTTKTVAANGQKNAIENCELANVYFANDENGNSSSQTNEDKIIGGSTGKIIKNSLGTLEITNVTVNGQLNHKTSAEVTINNSTITNSDEAIYNQGTGTINITTTGNNTIKSTGSYGIRNGSSGTITLGEKGDGVPGTEYPKVIGNTYGLYSNNSNGIFNFYDGSITGKVNQSINTTTTISDVETGYSVIVNVNEGGTTETAILGKQPVAKILKTSIQASNLTGIEHLDDDPDYYEFFTLQGAIDACTANTQTTILLERDLTFMENASTTTVASNKNIILDLNGLKLTAGNDNCIANAGTMKIIDSSGNGNIDNNTGNIYMNKKEFITNTGTLEIEKVKINSSLGGASDAFISYIVNESGANVKLIDNKVSIGGTYNNVIKNSGTATITRGNYSRGASKNNSFIIYNENSGDAKIDNSTIEFLGYYNTGTATFEAIDTTFSVANIYNYSTKVINNDNKPAMRIKGGTYNLGRYFDSSYKTFDVRNYAGEMVIENGSTNFSIQGWGWAIKTTIYNNGGKTIINSGTYKVNLTVNDGELEINNGTFTRHERSSTQYDDYKATIASAGTLSIYGGTMEYVNITNSGTVNIGKNDGNVSDSSPIIENLGTGSYNNFTSTGQVNFYDGKITYIDKIPVNGTINNIPANTSVLYTIDGNKHIYSLTTEPVAQIGNTTYSTLEAAFNAVTTNAHTQIDLLQSIAIIEGHEFTINNTQDITLNINGNKLYGAGKTSSLFTNEGKFELTDTTDGSITSYGPNIVKNSGNLTVTKGTFNVIENTDSRTIIYNIGTGTVTVTGGTFVTAAYEPNSGPRIEAYGINSTSTGNITVTGGLFNISGKSISFSTADVRGYAIKVNNSDSSNKPTVEIGGNVSVPDGTARSAFNINNAIFKITGGELKPTDTVYSTGYVNLINNSTVTITGGTISGVTHIDSNSTADISGAQTKVGAIINDGVVTATAGATFTGTFTNKKEATFENVKIETSSDTAINIEGGTVTDIKAGTIIEQTSTSTNSSAISINSRGKCTILGDVEITSSYGTGIYNEGTVTLGDNQAPVSTTKPAITGAVYGINNNGTFKFYDGLITGTGNRALTGSDPADKPTDYAVQISDDATSAWLESSAASTNVAKVNGISYHSLQSAINATSSGTITILSRIALSEPVTISSGKNLVIDMKSYSIEYSGTDAAITNNGTLTIIDGNEDGTSTQNYGIIANSVGPAIENNGTLTIGSDADSAVYSNSPRIQGATYAVVNDSSATFNFYDGILKGATAAVDGTITNTTSISGYTLTDGTESIGGTTYYTKFYN